VGEQVAQAAADWIGAGAHVLEIGVGTGRMARPLAAAGLRVTGLDLSAGMLAHLRTHWPGELAAARLVQADANRLPLAAGAYDAVVAVHVLQLLADWSSALAEARRVLRPGGVFLNGYEWRPPDSPGARLMARWRLLLAGTSEAALPTGARDFDDLQAELVRGGAGYAERVVGHWSTTRTLARQLETIEHRAWPVAAGPMNAAVAECLAQLKAWALAEYGALDQPHMARHRFIWQRFGWPGAAAPERLAEAMGHGAV
jgi:SAM-dependent methyltransferase